MRYTSIDNCLEVMTCKCGKEFTCSHETVRGEMEINHCMKCGRGNWADMCKGECSECYESPEEEFRKDQDKGESSPDQTGTP